VPAGPGADEQALSGVISDQVRAALRQLTQEQRQVIALAYLGGYTQSEVSAVTGLPLGTVKSRTFEEIALRDHLPHCTACRGARSDAEDVVGLLGTIPAQHQPPKLMAEIDHTPQTVQPSTPDTPPAVALRRRSRALLAAAAAIVIALGVSTTVLGIQVANRAQAWSTANPWR